jgi:hypothetical protein
MNRLESIGLQGSLPVARGSFPVVEKEENGEIAIQDHVSLSGAKNSTGKAAQTAFRAISLEQIDTPLEVVSSPVGDPGILSVVGKAIKAGKNVQASGSIKQGGKSYPVQFLLKENKKDDDKEPEGIIAGRSQEGDRGYDYDLSGKVGDMDMKLHCYSSGLSLMVEGNLGGNKVSLKNSYNLFTSKLTTTGSVGKVYMDFWSKSSDNVAESKGKIGGLDFYEKIVDSENGSTTSGKLGSDVLSGDSVKTGPGRYKTRNRAGDVEISYDLNFLNK